MFTDGLAAAIPARRRAIQAFRSEDTSDVGELRLLWLAANGAAEMWDDESWYVLSARLVRVARDAGALSELPLGLNSRIVALMLCGETAAAASLVEEDRAIREATGGSLASYGALVHAAWQGHETTTRELIDSTIREVRQRGEGIGAMVAYWAGALMFNGLGKYEDAATSALRASEFPLEFAPAGWGLVELVEATARAGDFGTARDALERRSEMTEAVGTHWALGVESRSRALLGGADSDGLYRQAIHHLSNTRLKVELARAHLLYGEWLRREGKRNEAREHLRTAHHQFVVWRSPNTPLARSVRWSRRQIQRPAVQISHYHEVG